MPPEIYATTQPFLAAQSSYCDTAYLRKSLVQAIHFQDPYHLQASITGKPFHKLMIIFLNNFKLLSSCQPCRHFIT